MSDIASKDFIRIDVDKKTPTFRISVLTDLKTKKDSIHVECANRKVLGIRGAKNVKAGVSFNIFHTWEEAINYMKMMTEVVKNLK